MEKLTMSDADYGALARAMRKVDFFAPLNVGELEQIVKYIMLCRYKAGETVFRQGDPGDAFYIVHDGALSVRVKTILFFKKQVARLGAGDFFGEMALLSRDPRSATVVCEEPTRLFVLLSADFGFMLKKSPAFAEEMRKLAERRKFMSRQDKR
ncbi:MAG: cyclic nucleotide-binding domain-containing protein [Elusimicrobia bacterium]|nr:cyclic nucleotide-binding domain-containing protein [Elusimicrobiota bacterium]